MNNFSILYSVHEALITEFEIISADHFTDASLTGDLIEITYNDFGNRSVNLVSKDREIYQMFFSDRLVTTDIKNAIRSAVKAYKNMTLKHYKMQPMESYFYKYYNRFPELFI